MVLALLGELAEVSPEMSAPCLFTQVGVVVVVGRQIRSHLALAPLYGPGLEGKRLGLSDGLATLCLYVLN